MAFFPAEWEDDNRMNFMFSAFPENRNVNPKHWDSKFQFWASAIIESCHSFDELYFDINVLKSRFRRKGVTPLGLSTVVKEMLNSGQVVCMSDFLDSVYDTWGEWTYGIAKRSLLWTVGKVWQNNEIEGSLLLLASVKVRKFASTIKNEIFF
jgi:charged multivesicular body protein 7